MRRIGLAALVVGVCGCSAALADRVVLIAPQMVAPNGSLVSDRAVVVENGLIVRVGDASEFAEDPDRMEVDGVLSPGLISLASSLGMVDSEASASSVEPDLRASDAFDPGQHALGEAARSGVTGAMIVPSPTNVVCGTAAFITTHAPDGEWFIDRDGPMLFAFGPAAYDLNLGPSSRSGVMVVLRSALDEARRGEGSERLREVLDGSRRAVAFCPAIDDVDSAFRAFDRYGVEVQLIHNAEPRYLAEALESTPTLVAMGPYNFSSPSWVIAGAGQVAGAGSDVALIGGAGSDAGRSVRTTAALAVRYGLGADAARRGITSTAALYAGVEEKVGSIEAGKRADLVVFSGDPLRLESTVRWVMVGGEWVVRPSASPLADDEFDFLSTMNDSEAR
jgi:hypothetical protein